MNKLIILCLILIFIILVLSSIVMDFYQLQNKITKIISHYIKIYESEKNMKQMLCKSNKDCGDRQVCQMDIDQQKRCFNNENMIQRICTKLVVPSYWSNLKTNTNQNIRNNSHKK